MAPGAFIKGAAAVRVVPRDVRSNLDLAEFGHEVTCVVPFSAPSVTRCAPDSDSAEHTHLLLVIASHIFFVSVRAGEKESSPVLHHSAQGPAQDNALRTLLWLD